MVSLFTSLGRLVLYDCPNLKGWRPPPSSSSLLPQFQHLSELSMSSCPNLTSTPQFPPLENPDIESTSFKSLEQMLKGKISPAHAMPFSRPSNLSSLKYLEINKIEHLPDDFLPVELVQSLTCLPQAKIQLLTSLKSLQIENCKDLDLSIYDDDSNSNDAMLRQGLRSLTFLRIDGIPKLVHLPKSLLLHSIVLNTLDTSHCPNLALYRSGCPASPLYSI